MNGMYTSASGRRTEDHIIGRRTEDHVNDKILSSSPSSGYLRLNKAN